MRIEYITGKEKFEVPPAREQAAAVSETVSDYPTTTPNHNLTAPDRAPRIFLS